MPLMFSLLPYPFIYFLNTYIFAGYKIIIHSFCNTKQVLFRSSEMKLITAMAQICQKQKGLGQNKLKQNWLAQNKPKQNGRG